jgi:hypothetical protein
MNTEPMGLLILGLISRPKRSSNARLIGRSPSYDQMHMAGGGRAAGLVDSWRGGIQHWRAGVVGSDHPKSLLVAIARPLIEREGAKRYAYRNS